MPITCRVAYVWSRDEQRTGRRTSGPACLLFRPIAHRSGGPRPRPGPASTHADDGLAAQHEDTDPDRDVAADRAGATAAADEHHAVGDRVEDLAELAALVEVPGDVAVDPVGGSRGPRRAGRPRPAGPRRAATRGRRARTASRTSEITLGMVSTAVVAHGSRVPVMSAKRTAGPGSDVVLDRGADREDRAGCARRSPPGARDGPGRRVAVDVVEVGDDREVVVALVRRPRSRPDAVGRGSRGSGRAARASAVSTACDLLGGRAVVDHVNSDDVAAARSQQPRVRAAVDRDRRCR